MSVFVHFVSLCLFILFNCPWMSKTGLHVRENVRLLVIAIGLIY